MSARVFISCGQTTEIEKDFCRLISQWLTEKGFQPYVAIQTQTILDLNHDIIEALKNSDYYLFVNFAREEVRKDANFWKRGSVFTNQELAMALALGIDDCLIINEKGVQREGIHHYLVSNTPDFNGIDDLLKIAKTTVQELRWDPNYSRHLVFGGLRRGGYVNQKVLMKDEKLQVLHADLKNHRNDMCFYGVVARLREIHLQNEDPKHPKETAPLKVSGFQGYEQVIFPKGTGTIDLLSFSSGVQSQIEIYSRSVSDVGLSLPICREGIHTFTYEIASRDFPVLELKLKLTVPKYDKSKFMQNVEFEVQ